MNNWIQITPERGRLRPKRGRFAATSVPMLLLLGGLLVGAPPARGASQLVLNPIPINPTNVTAGMILTMQISVANTDIIPPDQVIFQPLPLSGWPSNASITPIDGITKATFTWATAANQPLGSTNFTVVAFELDNQLNRATNTFTVTVTSPVAPEKPPFLGPIAPQTVNAGEPLQLSIYATNTDNTTNQITFDLTSSPITSATISNGPMIRVIETASSTNGVYLGGIYWLTALADAAGSPYTMTVTASEGSQSATQTFTVNVILNTDCPQYSEFLTAVEQGGVAVLTDCPILVVTNTIVISKDVTILAETNVIIAGNNLTRLFTVRPGGSLTLSGLTLQGGQSASGGAIYVMKRGAVVLSNCVVTGNSAAGAIGQSGTAGDSSDPNYGKPGGPALPGSPGLGGAIYNLGSLNVYGCQFTNNSALGGSGGNGGGGADGSYQGGNGGQGGNGAAAYGGAIYNRGSLVLSASDTTSNNNIFIGNMAAGGSGGAGGTNGTGAFNGYAGSGGSGAPAAGGAICSASDASIGNCVFSGNAAQGGSSSPGGTAGGGHGVDGAPGGSAYGGAVFLLGGGTLDGSSCQFGTNMAIGGNGGDGGYGNYGGGNGGNGGDGVGGCIYTLGKAGIGNLTVSPSGCLSVGGTNGAAGSGPFAGRGGALGRALGAGLTNAVANGVGAIALGNAFPATAPAGSPLPAPTDPDNNQAADNTTVATAGSANSAGPQAGPSVSDQGAAKSAAPLTSSPATSAPSASPATGPGGVPPGLPATRADRPAPAGTAVAPLLPGQTNATPAAPGAANSPGEEPLPEGMIDFRGADLNQVLEIYSLMVKRTLLRPATLPAPTIILKTQGQLTMREGIQALDAVLALNGITMVDVGEKFVKVVAEAQSGSAAAPFGTNTAAQLPELGQYVTHVVQLKYAKPSELVPILTPFIKIPNAILPLDTSQVLVLRDYAENVKRMLEMVNKIDVAVPSEFVQEVIAIKYAKASDIAGALNSLSGTGGGASVGGGGTTGTRGRTSGMGRTGGTSGIGGVGGYPGSTTPGATPFGQPGTTGTQGAPGAGGSSFTQRLQNIINRAGGSATGDIQVVGQTKIISDERTNSLLIFASKEDMKTIKDIISKLDVVLPQVLIEAAILEVDLTDSRSLGLSYLQHPQNSGQWTGVGAVNPGNLLQPGSFVSSGGTNGAGSGLASGFSYLMSFGQDLDVAVTAAAANSSAKILQRPRIQTSHNEPASIFVGTTQPYPTSSYYGGGAYGGYSSIQQLQIGVTLEVTPLINQDGLVVMDIHAKIDGLDGSVNIQNVGDVPITSSKEAQSKVSVRDHDTIILGGLIYTEKDKNASGVPLLMNIPLLGTLFRSSSANGTRNELIVLIRPTVLPTPEIAALTATAEKNKMPGAREAEREIRADEDERLRHANEHDQKNLSPPVRPQ